MSLHEGRARLRRGITLTGGQTSTGINQAPSTTIAVAPGLTAVTVPYWSTVATAGLSDLYVVIVDLVMSILDPLLRWPVTEIDSSIAEDLHIKHPTLNCDALGLRGWFHINEIGAEDTIWLGPVCRRRIRYRGEPRYFGGNIHRKLVGSARKKLAETNGTFADYGDLLESTRDANGYQKILSRMNYGSVMEETIRSDCPGNACAAASAVRRTTIVFAMCVRGL